MTFNKKSLTFKDGIIDFSLNDPIAKSRETTFFERVLQQIFMIFTKSGSEGGLFIFIGKKKK